MNLTNIILSFKIEQSLQWSALIIIFSDYYILLEPVIHDCLTSPKLWFYYFSKVLILCYYVYRII